MHLPIFYLTLGTIFIFIFFILPGTLQRNRNKKKLAKLREKWGKAQPELYRNFYLIEQYSLLQIKNNRLNTQTCKDIDFYELFSFLDRTQSCVGQQYLYHTLLHPSEEIASLQMLNNRICYFLDNRETRESFQLLLNELQKQEAYSLTKLLKEDIFSAPKWYPLAILNTLVVICLLVLSFRFPVLLIWMMAPFALNIVLHLCNKQQSFSIIQPFSQLLKLMDISKELIKKDIPFDIKATEENIQRLKSFRKKSWLLQLNTGSLDELSQAIFFLREGIKALFLVEIHAFTQCIKDIKDEQVAIHGLFNFVGMVDMSISIASVRSGEQKHCIPEFSKTNKQIFISQAYHPLIKNCVANSLNINGKGILITGSNMSGKTTFIRSVAINTLLAQTIYTCFADAITMPLLTVKSAIRMEDDVMEGKSFYYAEVEAIHELIQSADKSQPCLFVLDEVLKGTNTLERVAAAKAILSYLNKGEHVVLVSTHDLELADLLSDEYELYHFEEQIANDKLYFDHQIKNGKLTTRNAIRLLELSGFPDTIIREANQLARNT